MADSNDNRSIYVLNMKHNMYKINTEKVQQLKGSYVALIISPFGSN